MGQAQVNKKIRQAARRQVTSTKQEVLKALLSVKQWPLRHRWQFCKWLLFGKGSWKGVR